MWDGVLARFGEIGIKSQPVRRMMQARLRENLLDGLLREGIEGDVVTRGPRLWLVGPDPAVLAGLAQRTFGIVSVSPAVEVEADVAAMGQAAARAALTRSWTSFAVRARRQGQHDFTSQDIGIQVGSAVFEAAQAEGREPRVDLDTPELEVWIEVRDQRAYISLDHMPGPGGLPLGSQGRVAVLISDTASAVAAWLVMRRGCQAIPIHAGDMGSAPVDLARPLQRWGLGSDVTVLPVCSHVTTKEALLDAAAHVARQAGALALVTGDTLASRLLRPQMPVLRPVCGLARGEVARIQALVGLPDEEGEDVLGGGGDSAEDLLRLKQVVSV